MRYLITWGLLALALACYAAGMETGCLMVAAAGLCAEAGFWRGLFRRRAGGAGGRSVPAG